MYSIVATRGASEILTDPPIERLPQLLAEGETHVWVNLSSPIGEAEMSIVRDVFKFHPLSIEDCFEEREAPKIEDYGGYLYLITHGLSPGATPEESEVVELDAFLGPRFLVTHHHKPSRSVAATRETVLRTGLPLRKDCAGVLHAIIDRQVDDLEPLVETIEERIEQIEDAVFERPEAAQIEAMLAIRRNILHLRRWMSKQRDVVQRFGRGEFELIGKSEARLFRDVYDHMARFNDLLDNFREMLANILEAYMSLSSNRLAEIMRFLAVLTAILMPLTVITGVYGMNFEHMPELRLRNGYFATLGVMAAVAGALMIYFRYRGWLGRPPPMPSQERAGPPSPRPAEPRRS